MIATRLVAAVDSPTQGVWWLGPVPIRAYALCILSGIIVAAWLTMKRMPRFGATGEQALDVTIWAVPFGIIGGRIYHVITSWQPYFGPGGQPLNAFKIWDGGLGIWGAVALGAVGAWIGCRRHGVSLWGFADALAPGLLIAQGLGRWGNFFNNELYGGPTTLPWGIRIWQWDFAAGAAARDGAGNPIPLGVFHPTFFYEFAWCILAALLLLALERRFDFRWGQRFGLLLMLYTVERLVVELMRTDPANHILGLRLNVWTAVLVFALGLTIFVRRGRAGHPDPDREPVESQTVD